MGTHIQALARILDVPVTLVQQQVQHLTGKRSGTIRDVYTTQQTSSHQSAGPIHLQAGNSITAQAPQYEGHSLHMQAQGDINLSDVHDTHQHTEDIKTQGQGLFGRSSRHQASSFRSTARGPSIKVQEAATLQSHTGDIQTTALHLDSETQTPSRFEAPHGSVHFKQGVNTYQAQSTQQASNTFWQSASQTTEEHRTYTPCRILSPLEILAQQTVIQRVEGQAPLEHLKILEGRVLEEVLQELHHQESWSTSGPSAGLAALVGLAATLATGSLGGSLAASLGWAADSMAAAMTTAAVKALSAQAAVGLLSHHGDPMATLKGLLNQDALRALAVSMLSAGLGTQLPGGQIPNAHIDLVNRGVQNLLQGGVNAGLSMLIQGKDPTEAIKEALLQTVSSTFSQHFAAQIGQAYQAKEIGFLTHKLFHGAVGALGAKILDRDMASGALGAIVAETLAEHLRDKLPTTMRQLKNRYPSDSETELLERYEDTVRSALDQVKLETAVIALLLGQEVQTATDQAVTALENNCLQFLLQRAAMFLAALAAKAAPKVKKAFETMKKAKKADKVDKASKADKVEKLSKADKVDKADKTAKIEKKIASDEQIAFLKREGKSIAGKDSKAVLKNAQRLADKYGGKPEEWSKITTRSYRATDGTQFEIHAYRNSHTGEIFEPKTKITRMVK